MSTDAVAPQVQLWEVCTKGGRGDGIAQSRLIPANGPILTPDARARGLPHRIVADCEGLELL